MNEELQEYADSRGLSIRADRQHGIIRGVKILGTSSRNGRTYLAAAIAQAAPLYEGAKVNVNHPKGAAAGPRDYRDRIGVIRNVTARVDEGLFGDFHFNPKHALAEQLLWDAEHTPQNVGFSHNVQARTSRRGDTVVVEAITKVQSVDLVADPATTHGLFESAPVADAIAQPPARVEPSVWESLTVERLREARPDLVENMLADAQQQIAQQREAIERFQTAQNERQRRETALQLLAEHGRSGSDRADGWPRGVASQSFLETLTRAGDEATMRRLIRQRVDLIRELGLEGGCSRPLSREQTHPYARQPADVEAFVRCIS